MERGSAIVRRWWGSQAWRSSARQAALAMVVGAVGDVASGALPRRKRRTCRMSRCARRWRASARPVAAVQEGGVNHE